MNASAKRTIALIPARGGSKGLPGKNVRPIGGKPLIAHSVEHAIQSGVCDRVLVTTDSPEIKAAAEAAGAWCPFLREGGLAEDLTGAYRRPGEGRGDRRCLRHRGFSSADRHLP
jgi:CMP-N-acetylneuraminic acid synthetase